MPIYEYQCKKCGKVVEVFQKVSDPGPKTCERCGGKLGRLISHTSFQLKGGGWYKDLYASTKPGESSETKAEAPEAAKSESKAEAKADVTVKADVKPAKAEKKKPEPKKAKAAG